MNCPRCRNILQGPFSGVVSEEVTTVASYWCTGCDSSCYEGFTKEGLYLFCWEAVNGRKGISGEGREA